MKQGIRIVVDRVGEAGGLGTCYKYLVAPVMVEGGAEVVCPETVVVPRLPLVGWDMGHAKLADGVDRVGGKVEGIAVHTGIGRAGRVRGPRA